MMKLLRFLDFVGCDSRPYVEAAGNTASAMPIPSMVIGVLRNIPNALEASRQHEAAGDMSKDVDVPVPSMVTGLLHNTPAANNVAPYMHALRWIFTQGLLKASQGRSELTAQANEFFEDELRALGHVLKDHEMYSKVAHEYWGKRGLPLSQFFNDRYLANPWNYDPQMMDLSAGKVEAGSEIKINMKDINEYLQQEGMAPFSYGGYNGLIEYIETGYDPSTGKYWADRRYPKGRFAHEHDDRIGLDVSGATEVPTPEGKVVPRFADFTPPMVDRDWTRAVYDIFDHSNSLVEKAKKGEQVDIADITDKKIFEKISRNPNLVKKSSYRGSEYTLATELGYNVNYEAEIKDYAKERFGDPNAFQLVAFLISLAIDEGTENSSSWNNKRVKKYPIDFDQSQGGDQAIRFILNKMFPGLPDAKSMKVHPDYPPTPEAADVQSKRYTSSVIDMGFARAKRLAARSLLAPEVDKFAKGETRLCRVSGLKPNVDMDYLNGALKELVAGFEPTKDAQAYSAGVGDPASFARFVQNRNGEKKLPFDDTLFDKYANMGYSPDPSYEKRSKLKPEDPNYLKLGTFGLPLHPHGGVAKLVNGQGKRIWLKQDKKGKWGVLNPPEVETPGSDLKDKQLRSQRPYMFSGTRIPMNRSPRNRDRINNLGGNVEELIGDMRDYHPEQYGFKDAKDFDNFISMATSYVISKLKSWNQVIQSKDDIRNDVLSSLVELSGSYMFRLGDLNHDKLPEYLREAGAENPEEIIAKVKKAISQGRQVEEIRNALGDKLFAAFVANGKMWRVSKSVTNAIEIYRQNNPEAFGGDPAANSGGEGLPSSPYGSKNEPTSSFDQEAIDDLIDRGDEISDENPAERRNDPRLAMRIPDQQLNKITERPLYNIDINLYIGSPEQDAYNDSYQKTVENLSPLLGRNIAGGAAFAKLKTLGKSPDPTPENRGVVDAVGDFIRDVVAAYKETSDSEEEPSMPPKDVKQVIDVLSGYINGKLFNVKGIDKITSVISGIAAEFESAQVKWKALHPDINVGELDIETKAEQGAYSPEEFDTAYRALITSPKQSDHDMAARIFQKVQRKHPAYTKIMSKYLDPTLKPTADQPPPRALSGFRQRIVAASATPPAAMPTPPVAPVAPTPQAGLGGVRDRFAELNKWRTGQEMPFAGPHDEPKESILTKFKLRQRFLEKYSHKI